MGHALTIINSYWGTGGVLQTAMHEGIANYVAGLEDGRHVNDHEDIHALSIIKSQSLKPDEILRNNSKGSHYYNEAEQVIKFLEDKHPEVLDNLLKSLSTHGASRAQGNGFVDDFFTQLKSYVQEFKDWVDNQLNNRLQPSDGRALNTQQAEQPSVEEENTRSKRSLKEDEREQGEVVIESVMENMKDSEEGDSKHPLKIKPSGPLEAGKYKVELQVTYEDITKFYDAMKDKYHASREYNYEQMMVLYNNVIIPASQNCEKPITLAESYVADGHVFIKDQDFGTLDSFNEMFYKSNELI